MSQDVSVLRQRHRARLALGAGLLALPLLSAAVPSAVAAPGSPKTIDTPFTAECRSNFSSDTRSLPGVSRVVVPSSISSGDTLSVSRSTAYTFNSTWTSGVDKITAAGIRVGVIGTYNWPLY
ncbi:MAG: hypothetical protein Q7T55_09895, partial [Solirubrobacteraceae bacterium]|nr:hypothetical protein [Solirubrobacteraceae bacterium]